MGLRDLVLGAVLLASLPVAVWRPFLGLLVFSWLAYMRAPDMAWNIAPLRPSLWVAVATVAGVLLHREERLLVLTKRTVVLGLFFAAVAVSAVVAVDPAAVAARGRLGALADAAERGQLADLAKVVFVALLTTGLVRTADRARWLLLVIAGSLGLLAAKTVVQGVLSHPGVPMHGPGGAIGDNNDYGLALVMALPLLACLARDEDSKLLRFALAAMAVCCVGGVLLTQSRGGALALGLVAVVALVRAGRRRWVLVAAPAAVALAIAVTPGPLLARARDLAAGSLDVSARNRVVAWEKAAHMAAANPAFGVGPGNFQANWDRYPPQTAHHPVVAHNTYLQVFAESGAVAGVLYLALLAATLASLARLRSAGAEPWRTRYAGGVILSLAGFLVGALFLSRTHFDLVYHLVGVAVALGSAEGHGEDPAAVLRSPPWGAGGVRGTRA